MNRRTATLVWAALLFVPLAFMAVAFTVPLPVPRMVNPALWLAMGASALNIVLSRVLPPLLGPARAGNREAVAFTRMVVALALNEAAAMAPLVAYMVARDPRLLGVLAVDLLALFVLFPSEGRWAGFMPPAGGVAQGGGTVR